MIKLSDARSIQYKIGIGPGTNTKVELIATWTLMTVAKLEKIRNIMILGDSKCVIDWLSGAAKLEVLNLAT